MDGEPAASSHTFGSMPLLDMLAEVASATLKNDPTLAKRSEVRNVKHPLCFPKTSPLKKPSYNTDQLTLDQIRVLSDKMLLEMFAELTSDEIRKNYSYKCFLIPEKCSQSFTSFGNETRARLHMKAHLLTHIAELLAEANAPGKSQRAKFIAEPLNARRKRLQEGSIKKRKKGKQCVVKKRKRNSCLQEQQPTVKNAEEYGNKNLKRNVKNTHNVEKSSKGKNSFFHGEEMFDHVFSSSDLCKNGQKKITENCYDETCKKANFVNSYIHWKPDIGKKAEFDHSSKGKTKKLNSKHSVSAEKQIKNQSSQGTSNNNSASEGSVATENEKLYKDLDSSNVICKHDEPNTSNISANTCELNSKNICINVYNQPSVQDTLLQEHTDFQLHLQPQHDHSYTTVNGKKHITEMCHLHTDCNGVQDKELSDPLKTTPCCSSNIPVQIIIPTPPFPYVYVPLLPHIAEIVEHGNKSKCAYENIRENSTRDCQFECLVSSRSKQTRIRRVNKLIIPEELEPDTEDDENVPSDSLSECLENRLNEEEISNAKILKNKLSVQRISKKNSLEDSQAMERKLALKCIRALRTKKKDERGPLVCKICKNKSFTAQATLMYHYRSHAGIKPFSCTVCEATFTRQHSLNYHMLIHNNKSRFVCSDCGRNFRHPSHYKEHLRRHTGETPYECSDCTLRFKTRNTYKRHLKTRHGKILTAQGIRTLSVEEFYKVRTSPRKKSSRHSPVHKKDQETQWPEIGSSHVSEHSLMDIEGW